MRHSGINYTCAVLRASWLGCASTRTASAWQGELHMSSFDLACNEIIPQDRAIYWQYLENCGNGSISVPLPKIYTLFQNEDIDVGRCLGLNRGEVTFSDNVHFVSHYGLQQC